MIDYLFFTRTTGIFLGYQEHTEICSAIKAFCDETGITDFNSEKIIIKTRKECTGIWAIEAARHDIPWSLSRRATPDCEQIIGIEPHDAYALIDENPSLIYLSRDAVDD